MRIKFTTLVFRREGRARWHALARTRLRGRRRHHGPRPAGLDPRDTVPIWAQPGEFMHSLAAVRAYGLDVMNALNNRTIPAGLMRMLAGFGGGMALPAARSRGPGYAEGGAVRPARSTGGDNTVYIRAACLVNDGLTRDSLRTVSAGLREPRNLLQKKGGF